MTIGELIQNKDYDRIEYRIINQKFADGIFAGIFASKNGEIISLDGDSYSKDEEVKKYEEWTNEKVKNGLTIWVK